MINLSYIINLVIHLDKHLIFLIENYGLLVYGILLAAVFFETSITPFLPGDSLLFTLGVLANKGEINIITLIILLTTASFLGNALNFYLGKYLGHKILQSKNPIITNFFNKEDLEKTHTFFEKHGGKAIIISRFFPIVRTFSPFIAGIGEMNNFKYLIYNLIGGFSWVTLMLLGGFTLGRIPFVKDNFSLILLGLVTISITPVAFAFARKILLQRKNKSRKIVSLNK